MGYKSKISRLDYVNIREIWQHEAADFTTSLAEIDVGSQKSENIIR
jgi:hypothetical protein